MDVMVSVVVVGRWVFVCGMVVVFVCDVGEDWDIWYFGIG